MLKLNLGCGQNLLPGYTNVDKFDSFSPDVVCDLEKMPWPFETSSVSEIVLNHVLEHLGASSDVFLSIMKEMYRICALDATIHIVVPHPRSQAFIDDPTHVRPITLGIMELFSQKNISRMREIGAANSPLACYINVDFEAIKHEIKLSPHWSEKYYGGKISQEEIEFAMRSYFDVVEEIKIDLRVVK